MVKNIEIKDLCEGNIERIKLESNVNDISLGLELLTRLQTPHQEEEITLFNETLSVTRYDGDEVSSLFEIDADSSCIIFEKCLEAQLKPIEDIKDWVIADACSTPRKSRGSSLNTSDLNITGSPLACHLAAFKDEDEDGDFDLSSQEEENARIIGRPIKAFRGVALHTARSISAYLLKALKVLQQRGVFIPPVWIACHGHDALRTSFVGATLSEGKGCATLCLTRGATHETEDALPPLENMKAHFHLGALLSRVGSRTEATYEVFSGRSRGGCSVLLRGAAKAEPLCTLAAPLVGFDTALTVHLHLEPTDEKGVAYYLQADLQILSNLVAGLQEKCLKWYRKKDEDTVAHRLQQYFEEFNNKIASQSGAMTKAGEGKDSAANLDKIVEGKFLETRNHLGQFSDQMWNILKESDSLSELTEGFQTIFKHVSSGKIRPRIHPKKDTKFAVLCRSLMQGTGLDGCPALRQWDAIHMLIEIGLDKLKMDYVSAFQVCDLLTAEQLSPHANWSPSSSPHSECVSNLRRLMTILQVVVTLKASLNLSNAVLSHLAAKTLVVLEAKKPDLPKDFDFQVDMSLVKGIVENIVPSLWTYRMWTTCDENPGSEKTLKFVVKRDRDFFRDEGEEDRKGDKDPELIRDTDSKSPTAHKFFSLCRTKTGNIF